MDLVIFSIISKHSSDFVNNHKAFCDFVNNHKAFCDFVYNHKLLIKSKILDKNIWAKNLEIGGIQASVIASQVEDLVIIFPIKMGVFGSV